MQRRYGRCPSQHCPRRRDSPPHRLMLVRTLQKSRVTIPYVEIAALQCLAPLVDLAGKARKIETKNDY